MGKVFLVGCSGIIGVGKSQLLFRLEATGLLQELIGGKERARLIFLQEPVELWRTKGWLAAFYENTHENALAFQFLVFSSYVDLVRETIRTHATADDTPLVIVSERTMLDHQLFWTLQEKNTLQHTAYMELWRKYADMIPMPCFNFYFKTAGPEMAAARIKSRARQEETSASSEIPMEYLMRLHQMHEEWFSGSETKIPESTVCIPSVTISTEAPYHQEMEPLHNIATIMASCVRLAIL